MLQFEEKLMELTGRSTSLRPFVCEGNPLSCEVFIVGTNPATQTRSDFWDFWRNSYGFDKQAWFSSYLKDRQALAARNPAKRVRSISNTRQRLEWLIEEAAPLACLETNLFVKATASERDLLLVDRQTAIFEFLLNTIRPRLIIAHGKQAQEGVRLINPQTRVVEVPHFSRGWSQEKTRAFGRSLKQQIS